MRKLPDGYVAYNATVEIHLLTTAEVYGKDDQEAYNDAKAYITTQIWKQPWCHQITSCSVVDATPIILEEKDDS